MLIYIAPLQETINCRWRFTKWRYIYLYINRYIYIYVYIDLYIYLLNALAGIMGELLIQMQRNMLQQTGRIRCRKPALEMSM